MQWEWNGWRSMVGTIGEFRVASKHYGFDYSRGYRRSISALWRKWRWVDIIPRFNEPLFPEVPVVVHGAEGVDSTLLVTSIAQLCLDSDARTLRGFQSLIEHEWIVAGHPFTLRCSHSAYASGQLTGPFEAPIFLCFLDAVWQVSVLLFDNNNNNTFCFQIIRQYSSCFEFNEEFLIFLFEHAYASEFGSFLGNNEQEKAKFRVKKATVSLWSYVNHPDLLSTFLNPLYEPYDSVLWPSVAPQSIVSFCSKIS